MRTGSFEQLVAVVVYVAVLLMVFLILGLFIHAFSENDGRFAIAGAILLSTCLYLFGQWWMKD